MGARAGQRGGLELSPTWGPDEPRACNQSECSPPPLARRLRRGPQIAGLPRRRRSNRGNICSAVNQSNVGPVSAVAAAAAPTASSSSALGGGAGGGKGLRLAPRPRAPPGTGANEMQRRLKKTGAAAPLPLWIGGVAWLGRAGPGRAVSAGQTRSLNAAL